MQPSLSSCDPGGASTSHRRTKKGPVPPWRDRPLACLRFRLLPRRRLLLGQPLEVFIDRLPVVSRVVAIENVSGSCLSLRRQSAPAGAIARVAIGDVAGTLRTTDGAVLGGAVSLITTTRAVATARSRTALLFQFFNYRIQRGDDLVFLLLHALATSPEIQASLDVLHLPRDLRE